MQVLKHDVTLNRVTHCRGTAIYFLDEMLCRKCDLNQILYTHIADIQKWQRWLHRNIRSQKCEQEALLSQKSRTMLRIRIASIQKRSLLLLVVSASDIPLRTIKCFSVLFSLAYWSMLQAVTNKHSTVHRRTSSNQSIASGAWPTVSYTQLRRR